MLHIPDFDVLLLSLERIRIELDF